MIWYFPITLEWRCLSLKALELDVLRGRIPNGALLLVDWHWLSLRRLLNENKVRNLPIGFPFYVTTQNCEIRLSHAPYEFKEYFPTSDNRTRSQCAMFFYSISWSGMMTWQITVLERQSSGHRDCEFYFNNRPSYISQPGSYTFRQWNFGPTASAPYGDRNYSFWYRFHDKAANSTPSTFYFTWSREDGYNPNCKWQNANLLSQEAHLLHLWGDPLSFNGPPWPTRSCLHVSIMMESIGMFLILIVFTSAISPKSFSKADISSFVIWHDPWESPIPNFQL